MTTPTHEEVLASMLLEFHIVLEGLVVRIRRARLQLGYSDDHALLSTHQADGLLRRTEPVTAESVALEAIRSSDSVCSNPSCVDGLAPRKTGPPMTAMSTWSPVRSVVAPVHRNLTLALIWSGALWLSFGIGWVLSVIS